MNILSWLVLGPAVGKAGDCLDWITGGLEMKELKDSDNPCPLDRGPIYLTNFVFF